MGFTALHRIAGVGPGPLTEAILDAAVGVGGLEAADLDWKSALPPAKGLQQTDFPKDVAAMANSGGGLIVFGVRETQKAATSRVDVDGFDETYERALRSAAVTAISPPVFGLAVHLLGSGSNRAVVVEVPASVDGPHLIYRNEFFGAPIRNDADTVWMKERQIEAMYRSRFEERRHANEALDALTVEASAGRDVDERAWIIAIGRPRFPRSSGRLTRDAARWVLSQTEGLALTYAGRGGIHPLESVDRNNPRPGLRRWVFANVATGETSRWRESWISVHHNGAVTLASAVGGHRQARDAFREGWQVDSSAVECAIADFMALIRQVASATGNDEYDMRAGIEWSGREPLLMHTQDRFGGSDDGASVPLHRFTPVEYTVDASESPEDFFWHVHAFAEDCVNQGGVTNVRMIHPPERGDQPSPTSSDV